MVSEEQKKIFSDFLNNTFNENIINNEEVYQKTSKWLKNIYYKYINNTLPEEHKQELEKRLNKRNITIEEFLESKGNIEVIRELSKSRKKTKKDKKVPNKEELENLRDQLNQSITSLKNKITKRNKALYRLTDEACEEIEKQIGELEEQKKEINKKIRELEPKEKKVESEAASKKIELLLNEKRKQEAEIVALKQENAKYKEERVYLGNKYKEEYNKKFEVYSKQLKEEYDTKLDKEVEKQISKANQKSEKTLELQKAYILRMLLKNDNVSINEIKLELEKHKISQSNLDAAINELRIIIPGITKYYDLYEQTTVLSINAHATDRWNVLKEKTNSPRISNMFDGKLQFLEHSDLHLNLKSTIDDLKKEFEPIFDYASTHDNPPIINLGDLADTLREIEYNTWQNNDKEAIELSINFFKNFSKVLGTVPNLKYYFLFGNHEKHIFDAGVDPLEIMNEHCNNLIPLGAEKGSFIVGNDKIGVFHGFSNGTRWSDAIDEILPELATDCIYSLIGHYHIGVHKPFYGCSIVNNGINNILNFQATLKDGNVISLSVNDLSLQDNKIIYNNTTPTELYNSDYQYVKRSQ